MSTKKPSDEKKTESVDSKSEALNKELESTDQASSDVETSKEQQAASVAKTPVGIDFTDPEERKKTLDEVRQQNEEDYKSKTGKV